MSADLMETALRICSVDRDTSARQHVSQPQQALDPPREHQLVVGVILRQENVSREPSAVSRQHVCQHDACHVHTPYGVWARNLCTSTRPVSMTPLHGSMAALACSRGLPDFGVRGLPPISSGRDFNLNTWPKKNWSSNLLS